MPNLRSALFIRISGFKKRAEKSGEDFDHYYVKRVDRAKLLTLLDTRAREGVASISKPVTPEVVQRLISKLKTTS